MSFSYAWCNTCGRSTLHRVFDRRLAHCLEHGPKVDANGLSKSQAKRREQAAKEEKNPRLF
jgi:hypothetical protein